MSVEGAVIPWREVESPAVVVNGSVVPMLATVDALRQAWQEHLKSVSPEVFNEARQRNLRRHAIETGILERLYDLEWGMTESLVAEGLTLDAAARHGGIDLDTLATIRSQFGALEFLVASVRAGQPLTQSFIRELHSAITAHQSTYDAHGALGRGAVKPPLNHGGDREPDERRPKRSPPNTPDRGRRIRCGDTRSR